MKRTGRDPRFERLVGAAAARKLRMPKDPNGEIAFGLGAVGMVGWSVAIPTFLGAILGDWLDSRYPAGRSWTLALMIAGLCLGSFNAWFWVNQENKAINQDQGSLDA